MNEKACNTYKWILIVLIIVVIVYFIYLYFTKGSPMGLGGCLSPDAQMKIANSIDKKLQEINTCNCNVSKNK
jgi:hypothetical protein